MKEATAPVMTPAPSPLTNSAATLMPAMSVQQAIERYQLLISYVKELMRDGIDFGAVPGTDKPTLLKPGAEKLCTFFGLTKRFTIIDKVEDWTGKEHGNETFFFYLYRCALYHGDRLIAESDGSANSWENRYRWRWVKEDEVPPQLNKAQLRTRATNVSEFGFAIDKAETGGQYGKPASYWQMWREAIESGEARRIEKSTRAGKPMLAYELASKLYRVPNDDVASQVNTLQKMAQKRSLIAATLLAVNASEFFTQDVEDLAVDYEIAPVEMRPMVQAQPQQLAQPAAEAQPEPCSEPRVEPQAETAPAARAEQRTEQRAESKPGFRPIEELLETKPEPKPAPQLIAQPKPPMATPKVEVKPEAKANSGSGNGNGARKAPTEESATEFWKRVNATKIKKDEAMPIAQRAISGEITWEAAIAQLPAAA